MGIFVYLAYLIESKSFGVHYTIGINYFEKVRGSSFFLPSIEKREFRPSFLNPKKDMQQGKISMNWKTPK